MVLWVRFRLLALPLERDEGEFAYFGQLLLQGIPPYKLAYSMKLPGTDFAYALSMMVFGQTLQGIHLGLLTANLISIALLYFIAARLFGTLAGIFTAISYALLSMSQSVLGLQAHATHFVVLMVLFGLLFLLKAEETKKTKFVFLSGLFMGLAFLMKQHGIFFGAFGFGYLLWIHWKKNSNPQSGLAAQLTVYSLGALLPFGLTCAFLFWAGVFDRFWFWTFNYLSAYSTHLPPGEATKVFLDRFFSVAGPFTFLWVLALLGLIGLLWTPSAGKQSVFVAALLAVSVLSVCPGSVFQPHYFVTLLPVVSLLAGCLIQTTTEFIRHRKNPFYFHFAPVALFVLFGLFALDQQKFYLFEASPIRVSRQIYGMNPFAQSLEIGQYLKDHTFPTDTLAILGSEPEIYFYAQRHSATGYVSTYDLVESQPYALSMQQEMIREMESAQPRYLVFVNIPTSWVAQPGSPGLIFEWSKAYIRDHYEKVGLVDMPAWNKTDYDWDEEAKRADPHSPNFIMIYKRKN